MLVLAAFLGLSLSLSLPADAAQNNEFSVKMFFVIADNTPFRENIVHLLDDDIPQVHVYPYLSVDAISLWAIDIFRVVLVGGGGGCKCTTMLMYIVHTFAC